MSTIGFDTSNYTTSTAWTDGKTDINVRQILYVKDGERGIRQSDGVFQHMKLMPVMYEKLSEQIDFKDVKAVGVSTRPRCVEGSYMPVFLAGEGYAKVVANTVGGIYSSGSFELLENDFISVHLSGGTTEILKSRYNGFNFDNEIIGGSKDISAGQFIDRVGVKMGLHFPAGKALEQLALKTEKGEKLPIAVDGAYMNFSGVETKASRMAESEKCDKSALALGVLENVRDTLVKTINKAMTDTNTHRVLIVGGVASNGIIRNGLTKKLDGDVYFAKAEYSTDNAVGTAYLAHLAHKEA